LSNIAVSPAPIGVFDSGAGGLSVLAAIRAAAPGQPMVYFADTAYAPYGTRSDQEILARTQLCCSTLLERGVSALVVACNTATANAIDAVRAWSPVPVIGVEPGLKPAAAVTRNGVVGVLATRATLGSRRYRDLLHRVGSQLPQVRFVEHAAVGWVELVEAGDLDSVRARTLVRQAVQPLLDAGADTLVLGCTHYPFLRRAIETVAPGVQIVETGPAVARELQRRLAGTATAGATVCDARTDGSTPPLLQFESSGDPVAFAVLARQLLASVTTSAQSVDRSRHQPARA
jgi:glutamate racemase